MSHDGYQFVAEEVTRHETGPSVVMNCATFSDKKRSWIAAGQESHCQLYNIHSKIVTVENGEIPKKSGNLTSGLRQRNKSEDNSSNNCERIEEVKDSNSNLKSKRLQLIVKPMDSIQTDFG